MSDEAEDLADLVRSCWPADWPGQQLVELDNVGDPGAWLDQHVIEPSLDVLTEGEITDTEPLAELLVEDYLIALDQNSFDMPWAFGDDPSDSQWIAECQEAIRKEFVAFLRAWRANVQRKSVTK